ncbi:UDP-N-acetylglucosamine 2-epimerase [Herbihabitans rhizosphaerae]|uniref:UDP-N-acetylglucosamine 2-epimerase (non-hydrolyzing) n=1 Tax=Herbihabitans rhizosphaerae TaxID=1872711 RepID=A0A4Q7KFL8_9PSEU|nr:UDP-N-acetylglucosamine 2-epimerase (non-hydrolyzing) [Herbihabitans rhizosphaerae]RZS34013.1 UDP-N-acetylglucosamine 2-epimerase [Herbihabitans rhizosphaerae]
MTPEVWLVAGTRPEAVKLAPVAEAFDRGGRLRASIIATGQHPTMVDQALATFGRAPDVRLTVHREDGGQAELMAQLITGLDRLATARPPSAVIVQGDTTTTLAGSLVAFWRKIPVVHLEAGLRSFDLAAPFPEELNRRLVTRSAALHLAPTTYAAGHLLDEGVPAQSVLVTGNTVVDAISTVTDRPAHFEDPALADMVERATRAEHKLMLVTAHRRESWGAPLRRVLDAITELLRQHEDLKIVFPTHPNPAVRRTVTDALAHHPRVLITEPLPYEQLAGVLAASTIVLSDSGGIQEEAPTFGVPVLVLRDVTERMEAVDAGCAILVGTDDRRIVSTASALLSDAAARTAMTSGGNPFGDGRAAERTEEALAWLLGLQAMPPKEFAPAGARPFTAV